MNVKRRSGSDVQALQDWRAIERAATLELQRRAVGAHAQIVALLQQYGDGFTPEQLAAIHRRLRPRR